MKMPTGVTVNKVLVPLGFEASEVEVEFLPPTLDEVVRDGPSPKKGEIRLVIRYVRAAPKSNDQVFAEAIERLGWRPPRRRKQNPRRGNPIPPAGGT